MTKVVPFSKETFNAVKANPGAFEEDRTLGSFTVGPVVCRIVLSYDEDDEGYYNKWPNVFRGKYVIEALIDFFGWECFEEEDPDSYILEHIPFTCIGDFPVYLEETYEKTIERFQRDFFEYVLNNKKLTKGILESEIKARRFIESFDKELYKEILENFEDTYNPFTGDPYILSIA